MFFAVYLSAKNKKLIAAKFQILPIDYRQNVLDHLYQIALPQQIPLQPLPASDRNRRNLLQLLSLLSLSRFLSCKKNRKTTCLPFLCICRGATFTFQDRKDHSQKRICVPPTLNFKNSTLNQP